MTSQKRGVGILFMVVALLVVIGLVFVGYLQVQSWLEARDALAAEEASLTQAQQRLASLKQLSLREDSFREDLELLGQLMPEVILDENVIRDMQAGADLSDLRFNLIRFSDRARRDEYGMLPLTMTFEGTYHGVLNLLEYLSAYERATRIEELRLSPGSDADAGLLQANIRVSLFYE